MPDTMVLAIHDPPSTIHILVVCLALLLPLSAAAQPSTDTTNGDFAVYASSGQPATLDDVVGAMDTVSVVFVGEQHDDAVGHAVERELLERAYRRFGEESTRTLVLSMEMFERDVQPVLDEYLAGLITERHFLDDARPWSNYSDYRPLVEFARTHELPILAANAPRRYVNRVARLGRASLDALPPHAKAVLPPLPFPQPDSMYRERWMALMREAAHGAAGDSTGAESSPHGHDGGVDRMLDAQVLWDAAMAYHVAQQLMAQPDALVLHLTGAFHVEEDLGTPAQLRTYRPGTLALTVVMQPADDIDVFEADEHAGLGDFVILTEAAVRDDTAPQ